MKKFVPIEDVDGYVIALKREGFYTDLQIADIRKKHEDALKAQEVEKKHKFETNKFLVEQRVLKYISNLLTHHFEPNVDNVWECKVSLKVSKDGTIKTKIVFPFAEFDHWMTHNLHDKPPLPIILRAMRDAGASKDMCKEIAVKF
jgi:hypothetical protein